MTSSLGISYPPLLSTDNTSISKSCSLELPPKKLFRYNRRYCADFLLASDETSEEQPTRDYGPLITPESLPVSKPAGAIVRDLLRATSRDEAGGGEMSKGLGQVKPLIGEPSNLFGEEIERGKQSFPNGMAPTAAVENTASAGETNQDTEKVGSEKLTTPCRQRRLRVGFLSAYFFHHSVGLLTEGVVTGLDRRRFETIAIFLQPGFPSVYHGTNGSASDEGGGGGGGGDRVYETIRSGTERLLDLPANRCKPCKERGRTPSVKHTDMILHFVVFLDDFMCFSTISSFLEIGGCCAGHLWNIAVSSSNPAAAKFLPPNTYRKGLEWGTHFLLSSPSPKYMAKNVLDARCWIT